MRHVRFSPAELVREHLKCDLGSIAIRLPNAFFVSVNRGHVAETSAQRHVSQVILHVGGLDDIRASAILSIGTAVTSAFRNFGDQRLVVVDIAYNASRVVGAEVKEQSLVYDRLK